MALVGECASKYQVVTRYHQVNQVIVALLSARSARPERR